MVINLLMLILAEDHMKDNDQNKYDKSINKIADIENKINSIKSKHKLIDKDNVKPNAISATG